MPKRVDERAWRHEEAECLRGLRARRPDIRAATIARLCVLFDPLVKNQAKVYRQHVIGGGVEDLEQVARIGLLEAIASFRPERGAFPVHAMWSIRNALSKYVEGLGNPVALPAWLIRRVPKLRRLTIRLTQELLREPTHDELASAMGMPREAIDAMLIYQEGPRPLPIEVTGHPFSGKHRKRWETLHRRSA